MLVVGGENEDGAVAEVLTLALDTFAWAPLATLDTPRARTDFAATLDAARNRLITFGGRRGLGNSIDEIWALDLETNRWSALPTGPVARHDIVAASDGERVWIFGGAGALFQSLNDLWEFDLRGNTWRQLPSAGQTPDGRTSYAIAFFQNALWLYGGHDVRHAFHDAWRYDLTLQTWTQLHAPGQTPAGAHFGQAFDALCGQIVTTGGDNLDNFNVAFTDRFVLGAAPHFLKVGAATLPPARDHPSMVLDGARRRLILFGGGRSGDGSGTLNDAWTRDLEPCS